MEARVDTAVGAIVGQVKATHLIDQLGEALALSARRALGGQLSGTRLEDTSVAQ